jgi:hypothetical protein
MVLLETSRRWIGEAIVAKSSESQRKFLQIEVQWEAKWDEVGRGRGGKEEKKSYKLAGREGGGKGEVKQASDKATIAATT